MLVGAGGDAFAVAAGGGAGGTGTAGGEAGGGEVGVGVSSTHQNSHHPQLPSCGWTALGGVVPAAMAGVATPNNKLTTAMAVSSRLARRIWVII